RRHAPERKLLGPNGYASARSQLAAKRHGASGDARRGGAAMNSVPARNWTLALPAVALQALLISTFFGQSPEPPLYRRVFVPEESLNNHVRGLLPLKRDEFERRIALAAEQNDPSADKPAIRIEQAIIRARLDGGQLVNGEAELVIVSANNEPTL